MTVNFLDMAKELEDSRRESLRPVVVDDMVHCPECNDAGFVRVEFPTYYSIQDLNEENRKVIIFDRNDGAEGVHYFCANLGQHLDFVDIEYDCE
jgi:hypothetical protein